MANPAETKVNLVEVRRIAGLIGEVVDDHQSVFTNLADHKPNAGKFDAAMWLEDLFADRRDGIMKHVDYLRMVLDEMSTGLLAIADAFEGLDAGNADSVAKFNTKAKEIVGGMDDAEFEPTKVEPKTYDSGDNKPMDDELLITFGKDENGKPTVVFDPTVPGIGDFLVAEDVLPGDGDLNFEDAPGMKDENGFEVDAGPAGPPAGDPNPPAGDPPPDDPPPPVTTESALVEPNGDHFKYDEFETNNETWRYYPGGPKGPDGELVYWYNSETHLIPPEPVTDTKYDEVEDDNRTYRYYPNGPKGPEGQDLYWYNGVAHFDKSDDD